MHPVRSVTVSELKNTLLEVVRRVERGEVFEITKNGEPVATLAPCKGAKRPATGFGRVEIRGSLELPAEEWTLDLGNLKRSKRTRR
jgi:prevent-host-death family protein